MWVSLFQWEKFGRPVFEDQYDKNGIINLIVLYDNDPEPQNARYHYSEGWIHGKDHQTSKIAFVWIS